MRGRRSPWPYAWPYLIDVVRAGDYSEHQQRCSSGDRRALASRWTNRSPAWGRCVRTRRRFSASDPKTQEAPFGWVQEECTPKLYPSAKGEYVKDVLAEMERLNVTAVVFGDPKGVQT